MHRTGWQALARLGTTAVAFCAVTLLVFMSFYAASSQQPFSRRARLQPLLPHSLRGYLTYLRRLLHGDLGNSLYAREPVTTHIFRAVPVTLSVLVGGLFFASLFALLPLLRPPRGVDRGAELLSLVGISIHPVWMSLVLSWLFGAHWHVLGHQEGYCGLTSASTGCNGVPNWASHLILPWVVYGAVTGAYYSLAVRALVRGELTQDYVRGARMKGLGERRIARAHILRNISPQLIALFVTNLGIGFGSLIFIETVFGLPGLGNMFLVSLRRHDVPVTSGIVMLAVTTILVLSLVADVAAIALEPRTRLRRRDRPADDEHVEQLSGELGVARVR